MEITFKEMLALIAVSDAFMLVTAVVMAVLLR